MAFTWIVTTAYRNQKTCLS